MEDEVIVYLKGYAQENPIKNLHFMACNILNFMGKTLKKRKKKYK